MDEINKDSTPAVGNGATDNGFKPDPNIARAQAGTVEMLRYWLLLWSRRWLIGGTTLAVMVAIWGFAFFIATPWYQAQALITPISPSQTLASENGGSMMGGLGSGGLEALLGFAGQSDNAVEAQRYMAIMNSFAFTTTLDKRYGLSKTMAAEDGRDLAKLSQWKRYELINRRFASSYDYETANVTLSFIDQSPERADRILGDYLNALRDKLRSEEVSSAQSAAAALEDEIKQTSDNLLQNQLYELLARQIQRQKLAQIQADFAFKVIEPPVTPDKHYSPRPVRDAALGGAFVLVLLCGWFVGREWIARARLQLEASALSSATDIAPDSHRWQQEHGIEDVHGSEHPPGGH